MRVPTPEQQAKENALLYTTLADLAIFLVLFVTAIATLSLTLLSKVIRVGLMLVIGFNALFILRKVHRDRFQNLRFGIGKIEQMCKLAVGSALLLSGFWVANHVFVTLLVTHNVVTPLGLAIAASVGAVHLLVNTISWLALYAQAQGANSTIFQAQLSARTSRLISGVVVQIAITVAALAKDPIVSVWMDGLGATISAVSMVVIGINIVRQCLPNLLDHGVPDTIKREIEAGLLSAGIAPEELVGVRTRQAGSLPQLELTLVPAENVALALYTKQVAHVEDWLHEHLGGADVSVVIDANEP